MNEHFEPNRLSTDNDDSLECTDDIEGEVEVEDEDHDFGTYDDGYTEGKRVGTAAGRRDGYRLGRKIGALYEAPKPLHSMLRHAEPDDRPYYKGYAAGYNEAYQDTYYQGYRDGHSDENDANVSFYMGVIQQISESFLDLVHEPSGASVVPTADAVEEAVRVLLSHRGDYINSGDATFGIAFGQDGDVEVVVSDRHRHTTYIVSKDGNSVVAI